MNGCFSVLIMIFLPSALHKQRLQNLWQSDRTKVPLQRESLQTLLQFVLTIRRPTQSVLYLVQRGQREEIPIEAEIHNVAIFRLKTNLQNAAWPLALIVKVKRGERP